jgi:hypothetical protein
MANLAAFIFLLRYLCSAHGLLSLGKFWSPGTPSSLHSRSAQLSGARPLFTSACWHTQHHSTAPSASPHCSQQHVGFKPSPTMPVANLPEFSPIRATARSGDFTPSGRSTDTPVFSFSITSGEYIFQNNIALLITPQEYKIHAIFGSHLAPAGVCSITKTQTQAKRKAAKNAKAESVKDKKLPLQLVRPSLSQRKRSSSFIEELYLQ